MKVSTYTVIVLTINLQNDINVFVPLKPYNSDYRKRKCVILSCIGILLIQQTTQMPFEKVLCLLYYYNIRLASRLGRSSKILFGDLVHFNY